MSESEWLIAGASFGRLLLSCRRWVDRRVERITFVDQQVTRREVTVDFVVPDAPPVIRSRAGDLLLLPLARLPKRTLTNFDLADESGRRMSLLPREHHKRLVTEALYWWAKEALEDDPDDPDELRRRCEAVATSPPERAQAQLAALHALGVRRASDAGRMAQALVGSFLMTVSLRPEPGARRTLRFSYDERVGDPYPGWRNNLTRGLGWRSKSIWFPIPDMNDVPSYHLDIEAPTGLWIAQRELFVTDDAKRHRNHGTYTRAHFYYQPKAHTRGLAFINLRPQTSTILRAATAASWLALLLLLTVFCLLVSGGFRDNDTNAAALLLFIPAAVSALLVRSGEHAMTTDMLWFMRIVTLIPSGLAFIGGLAFAALPRHSSVLPYLFGVLTILAYFPTASLTLAWRLCAFPSDPDRVKTRAAHTF